jgi:hypothetical protein
MPAGRAYVTNPIPANPISMGAWMTAKPSVLVRLRSHRALQQPLQGFPQPANLFVLALKLLVAGQLFLAAI